MSGQPGWRTKLDVIATIVMLLASGGVLVALVNGYFSPLAVSETSRRPPVLPLPSTPLSLSGAEVQGSRSARAAVVEYADYQCPSCGRFDREMFPAFKHAYVDTGKALFAFRNLPLDKIHPFARKAADAAVCAGEQGQFWAMHDALFGDQAHLMPDDLKARADRLDLAGPAFDACLKGGAEALVNADVASARALHVTGTPAFFVGTVQADGTVKVARALPGAEDEEALAAAVDQVLKTVDGQ